MTDEHTMHKFLQHVKDYKSDTHLMSVKVEETIQALWHPSGIDYDDPKNSIELAAYNQSILENVIPLVIKRLVADTTELLTEGEEYQNGK